VTIPAHVTAAEYVEVRCPVDLEWPDGTCRPGRLFLKVKQAGGSAHVDPDSNWMELACDDCKRRLVREGARVHRVLHYFNLLGELVDTRVEPARRRP
jgi:hypothetical protein